MKDGEFKTVAKYTDPMLAHIDEGMLRENGIPAMVFGEASSYPSIMQVNPVELKVNAEDYDAAMALLQQTGEIE